MNGHATGLARLASRVCTGPSKDFRFLKLLRKCKRFGCFASAVIWLLLAQPAFSAGLVIGSPPTTTFIYNFNPINEPNPTAPPNHLSALDACNAVDQASRLDRIGLYNAIALAAAGYSVTWTGGSTASGGPSGSVSCHGIYNYLVGTAVVSANIYYSTGTTLGTCPANASPSLLGCICNANFWPNATDTACVQMAVPDGEPQVPTACTKPNPGSGDPFFPIAGNERYSLDTGITKASSLNLLLTYDSLPKAPVLVAGDELDVFYGVLGDLWSTNLHKRLFFGPALKGIRAVRGSGRTIPFFGDGSGGYSADPQINDRLTAAGAGYRYVDADTRSIESYDGSGKLLRVDYADGWSHAYIYSDSSTPATVAPAAGYLLSVSDPYGRAVQFEYDSSGRVSKAIGPSGAAMAFSTTGGRLNQVDWIGSGWSRLFHYENPSLSWAMTGITDEKGVRYASVGYDTDGRAISSELAGGVDRYSVVYTQPPSVTLTGTLDASSNLMVGKRTWQSAVAPVVTDPLGTATSMTVGPVGPLSGVTARSQAAGSGCGASSSSLTYDSNGNPTTEDDFNGKRVCRAFDLGRNLESARAEGLANTASCSAVTPSGSPLPAGSRKVTTAWHPDWRLPSKVAEPGRITTSVYNGQPDPFNGNAVASCAPATALLSDGKPIAVLCRQVEQATTDANGALGFSATLQAGVANREQKWTYNDRGQVLTHDGPRTDVSDLTTYAYYTDTVFTGVDPNAVGHTIGDLKTVTNGKGQVTQYTKYDKHGNVLESIDPNGVVSSYVYDLRQRLLSATVGGQTTSYTYDPVGQLTRVTLPDTSWIGYEYDDAHRQKAVLDSRGNRIDYVLDNAGNRTGETVKDPGGALKRQLARSIDALGRIQQATGRE